MTEGEKDDLNLLNQTAADMSLAVEDMETTDYITAATNQLHSLLSQMDGSGHHNVLEIPTATSDLSFKQELKSPTQSQSDSLSIPAHLSEIDVSGRSKLGQAEVILTGPACSHQSTSHNQDHNRSLCNKDNNNISICQNSKVPRTEIKVHLKRLSPATVAAAQRRSVSTKHFSSYGTRNKKGIYERPRHTELQGSRNNRHSLNKQSDRHADAKGQETIRTLDDLSLNDLKKLLMRSQTTIQFLSDKLKERERCENEVFGRLIGKMIGSVKSKWRLEGLKLHIHNLVCETILQDMEESGS